MTTTEATPTTLSEHVGTFVTTTGADAFPPDVLDRARHLILDAVGIAFASTAHDYARVGLDALAGFGSGDHPVLGMSERLPARDAAVLNGVLIHGLDYDDSHFASLAHPTAPVLPATLAAAVTADASAEEMLAAYVLGVEVTARVGMGAAHGELHATGFHPTAIAGAFGPAAAAGRLAGLDAHHLADAQGIVGSMAAGLMQFLDTGAWTKRLHPGWTASSALSAVSFAAAGWSGPPEVYEGRFGLFATHIGDRTNAEAVARDLGRTWELRRVAIKPYPICHYIHSFADAALALRAAHNVRPGDITAIRCAINPVEAKIVTEPAERKWAPRSEYDAKFSLPYVVATALTRGTFGVTELGEDARQDPAALELARRIEIVDDPDSRYPEALSGVVEIDLADGRTVRHREDVNRGHPERPLTETQIVDKFHANIGDVASPETVERVRSAVLSLGDGGSARTFAEACRA